jgi:hypothetical protein
LRRLATLALGLVAAACGRNATGVACPQGMDEVQGICLCSTADGCAAGEACVAGQCVCASDYCCPQGYLWDPVGKACACQATACCPKDYSWDSNRSVCACSNSSCCPSGYNFISDAGCFCAASTCCPRGTQWDPDAGSCACRDDHCCPVGYVYDPTRLNCTCGQDSCCPKDHSFDPTVKACVCSGPSCCPTGFARSGDRCVCVSNQSCGTGRACDQDAGACFCTSSQGCPGGFFCNASGSCQTLSGCVSNQDCPSSFFCAVDAGSCSQAECSDDAQCPIGQVCRTDSAGSRCAPGCWGVADCPLRDSCQPSPLDEMGLPGTCSSQCTENDFCSYQQFCDVGAGSCAFASQDYCSACVGNSCPGNNLCLFTISEGQPQGWCAVPCNPDGGDEDAGGCPSGFLCENTVEPCASAHGCTVDQGIGVCDQCSCHNWDIVNNPPEPLCTDPASAGGQPHQFQSFCTPTSGFCALHGP